MCSKKAVDLWWKLSGRSRVFQGQLVSTKAAADEAQADARGAGLEVTRLIMEASCIILELCLAPVARCLGLEAPNLRSEQQRRPTPESCLILVLEALVLGLGEPGRPEQAWGCLGQSLSRGGCLGPTIRIGESLLGLKRLKRRKGKLIFETKCFSR